MSGSDSISPTAHYTGYVWARAGLSHPESATVEGRLLFETLQRASAWRCSGSGRSDQATECATSTP